MSSSDIFIGVITGTMMFGGFIGQTTGLKYTTVGNNAFLTSAYVILVPFLAWIYTFSFEFVHIVWDRNFLLSMVYITLFGSVITHITVTVALKYTTSTRGAVLCATESLFGVFLAAIFLGERLRIRGRIGAILVLAAVLVAELGRNFFKEAVPAGD